MKIFSTGYRPSIELIDSYLKNIIKKYVKIKYYSINIKNYLNYPIRFIKYSSKWFFIDFSLSIELIDRHSCLKEKKKMEDNWSTRISHLIGIITERKRNPYRCQNFFWVRFHVSKNSFAATHR